MRLSWMPSVSEKKKSRVVRDRNGMDITPDRILAIPGFGPATATKLFVWRQTKEGLFRFNPNHPVALAELNAIEADLGTKTQQLASILRSGPTLMRQASEEAARVLAETEPLWKERWTDWELAKRRRQDL